MTAATLNSPAAPAFTPAALPGLQGWWEADLGITTNGVGHVDSWLALSPTGVVSGSLFLPNFDTAALFDPSTRPVWNIFSGDTRKSVQFTGSYDPGQIGIVLKSYGWAPNAYTNFTAVLCVRVRNAGPILSIEAYLPWDPENEIGPDTLTLYWNQDNNLSFYDGFTFYPPAVGGQRAATGHKAAGYYLITIRAGVSAPCIIRLNGVQLGTCDAMGGPPANNANRLYCIALGSSLYNWSASGEQRLYSDCNVYALALATTNWTDAQVLQCENYFSGKYP